MLRVQVVVRPRVPACTGVGQCRQCRPHRFPRRASAVALGGCSSGCSYRLPVPLPVRLLADGRNEQHRDADARVPGRRVLLVHRAQDLAVVLAGEAGADAAAGELDEIAERGVDALRRPVRVPGADPPGDVGVPDAVQHGRSQHRPALVEGGVPVAAAAASHRRRTRRPRRHPGGGRRGDSTTFPPHDCPTTTAPPQPELRRRAPRGRRRRCPCRSRRPEPPDSPWPRRSTATTWWPAAARRRAIAVPEPCVGGEPVHEQERAAVAGELPDREAWTAGVRLDHALRGRVRPAPALRPAPAARRDGSRPEPRHVGRSRARRAKGATGGPSARAAGRGCRHPDEGALSQVSLCSSTEGRCGSRHPLQRFTVRSCHSRSGSAPRKSGSSQRSCVPKAPGPRSRPSSRPSETRVLCLPPPTARPGRPLRQRTRPRRLTIQVTFAARRPAITSPAAGPSARGADADCARSRIVVRHLDRVGLRQPVAGVDLDEPVVAPHERARALGRRPSERESCRPQT